MSYKMFFKYSILFLLISYTLDLSAQQQNKEYTFIEEGLKYDSAGEYEKAVKSYTSALEMQPGNPDTYFFRGNAYLSLKLYEKAVSDYNNTLKIYKSHTDAFNNRGICRKYLGDTIGAISDYTKAIECEDKSVMYYKQYGPAYTKNVEYNRNRGLLYFEKADYIKAYADFNEIVIIDSTDYEAYNLRGLCQYMLKNYDMALNDFNRSEPGTFNKQYIYNNKAYCYFKKGNLKEACYYWNLAINLHYEYNPIWKRQYNFDDPKYMIQTNCR